jgi:hypothetical protein
VVDGVEDQDTFRTEHPRDLRDDLGQVGDVLEELPGYDDICDMVTQGEGHRIGPQGDHAVTRGHPEGRRREVDANMTIGVEVSGEKATAAADVDERHPPAGGSRDQARPTVGQPVEGGERPPRFPPLAGQTVVLPGIIPCSSLRSKHAGALRPLPSHVSRQTGEARE